MDITEGLVFTDEEQRIASTAHDAMVVRYEAEGVIKRQWATASQAIRDEWCLMTRLVLKAAKAT